MKKNVCKCGMTKVYYSYALVRTFLIHCQLVRLTVVEYCPVHREKIFNELFTVAVYMVAGSACDSCSLRRGVGSGLTLVRQIPSSSLLFPPSFFPLS